MRKINPETYEPTGYRLMVLDDPVEEKINGIILPNQTRTADEFAQQFGTVVRMGPKAFSIETPTGVSIDAVHPNIGDVVNYAKYAGGTYQTDDKGSIYRIINDDDILGIVERYNAYTESIASDYSLQRRKRE